jgi:hypothetical protein
VPSPAIQAGEHELSTPKDIAVLVGSLRRESFNRKMAHVLAELVPPALKLVERNAR